jgi:hypothetical protein
MPYLSLNRVVGGLEPLNEGYVLHSLPDLCLKSCGADFIEDLKGCKVGDLKARLESMALLCLQL